GSRAEDRAAEGRRAQRREPSFGPPYCRSRAAPLTRAGLVYPSRYLCKVRDAAHHDAKTTPLAETPATHRQRARTPAARKPDQGAESCVGSGSRLRLCGGSAVAKRGPGADGQPGGPPPFICWDGAASRLSGALLYGSHDSAPEPSWRRCRG